VTRLLIGEIDDYIGSAVTNTRGEVLFPRMIQKEQVTEQVLFVDTEGLFQPVEGVDPEFVKQVLLDQVIRSADMIILVVDRINIAEIEILKELRSAMETSRVIKKIMVIHNLKSILTKNDLKDYISELPDALGLEIVPNTLICKSFSKLNEQSTRIDHIFLKYVEKIKEPDGDTSEQMRYILRNLPETSCVDFNLQLGKALSTITNKYYRVEQKDNPSGKKAEGEEKGARIESKLEGGLILMVGPTPEVEGKTGLVKHKVTIATKVKGEKRMEPKEIECEVMYKFNNELKTKFSVQNWSYWEQNPIKFNQGDVYQIEEDDIYYLKVELQCPGLALNGLELDFRDESTICITGKKFSIEDTVKDVIQILKIRFPIALMGPNKKWMLKRVHVNSYRNVVLHVMLNVDNFKGARKESKEENIKT